MELQLLDLMFVLKYGQEEEEDLVVEMEEEVVLEVSFQEQLFKTKEQLFIYL
tara:strand:+ start:71 stop:226 length:156 start_codon:yes stop_codon:yes gene_type:complete